MGNPKQKWTSEEEEALRAAWRSTAPGSEEYSERPEFNHLLFARSNIDLKDKWRNLSVANGQGPRDKARTPKAKANPAVPLLLHCPSHRPLLLSLLHRMHHQM
ncbi:Telomere repeat-binding factor 1 [Sesamum angolense]|uniref:Telomere repeat-binding factor 1 n=1 Tax=Sesamum angolense TaxID=2727404 RepID=A0AAE1WEE1_9LAMI|nr:Telomere repeat-binding factor 1 [Sesamum angolense]